MGTKNYYINETESKAAEINKVGSVFTARVFDVGSVTTEEFESFANAKNYMLSLFGSSEDWAECNKSDFDRMLADLAEEGDAILEDWFPGIAADDNFDDFPSFMND